MTTLGAFLLAAIGFLAFPLMVAMAFAEHYRLDGPYGKSVLGLALAAAFVLISPLGLPMEVLAPILIAMGIFGVPLLLVWAVVLFRQEAKR